MAPKNSRTHGNGDNGTLKPQEQERSRRTKAAIIEATIEVIASQGVKAVTHRSVAAVAHASTASTAYHFGSIHDLVQETYRHLVEQNRLSLESASAELRKRGHITAAELCDYMTFVSIRSLTERRRRIIAWLELMFEAARDPDMRKLVNNWYQTSLSFWRTVAEMANISDAQLAGKIILEFLVGRYFLVLSIGARDEQMLRLRASIEAIIAALQRRSPGKDEAITPLPRLERKEQPKQDRREHQRERQARGEDTRQRIVEAAIRLLARSGPSGAKSRQIAEEAGVSLAATTYHFDSKLEILTEAYKHSHVLEVARYREAVKTFDLKNIDRGNLVNFVCDYLLREVTEFREYSLAIRELMLETARQNDLRDYSRQLYGERITLWRQLLHALGTTNPNTSAEMVLNVFSGRVILMLALGGEQLDPDLCKAEIAHLVGLLSIKSRPAVASA